MRVPVLDQVARPLRDLRRRLPTLASISELRAEGHTPEKIEMSYIGG